MPEIPETTIQPSVRSDGAGAVTPLEDAMKRVFDVVFALVGIVIFSPLLLVTACWVKIVSPGPIFYRGVRIGLRGKPFRIFKFRTMVVNAEAIGLAQTARNDSRVIPGGQFLRKYKLDELPQLFDVLRGEMSVVGPRPEVKQYTDLYTGEELIILSVRPGITDFSSIEFVSQSELLGDDNPREVFEKQVLPKKNQLRIRYVRGRSLLVDFKIIIKTIFVVVGKMLRRSA